MVSSKVYRQTAPGGKTSIFFLISKHNSSRRKKIDVFPPGTVYPYTVDDTIIMCVKTVLCIKSYILIILMTKINLDQRDLTVLIFLRHYPHHPCTTFGFIVKVLYSPRPYTVHITFSPFVYRGIVPSFQVKLEADLQQIARDSFSLEFPSTWSHVDLGGTFLEVVGTMQKGNLKRKLLLQFV